jgi:RNA polymerase sigma factor (sigma-70 family)
MDEAHSAVGFVLRHEYGRLMASLLREFGAHRVATIEDGLSQAFVEATTGWRSRGVPANARGWVHRAARHRIIDELRRQKRSEGADALDEVPAESADEPALSDDIRDDELRALFATAAPSIPLPSQLVFALRTLCGFSTKEIATRLVISEENVQKRWERAREGLRTVDLRQEPEGAERAGRVDAVLRMIYVLFTEGYFASTGESVLRLSLCEEALRLARIVAEHPRYTSPDSWALLALMHLHHARRDARTDAQGHPVLLEDQDRSLYRRDELALGLEAMDRAGAANSESKYTIEATIAGEHAFAPSFADTRWPIIAALYTKLTRIDPSPLHELHRAIAVSYAESPRVALELLDAMRPPTWLEASHLWLATYGDFHRRLGDEPRARVFYERAIARAPALERSVLERRLQQHGVSSP